MGATPKMIIEFRRQVILFFKSYETLILFIAKFLSGLIIFSIIGKIGLYDKALADFFTFMGGWPYILLFSVFFTIFPPTLGNLLILTAASLQISESLEVSVISFLLGVCVIVFYARLEPKKSFLIIATVLGFYFRIPYAVVIFAGLYVGFAGIAPVTIGAAIWNFLPMFGDLAKTAKPIEMVEFTEINLITDSLADIYGTMHAQATGDITWIFTAFIFVMVIILVHAVSRLTMNYSRSIAIALGSLLCIFGSFMASAVAGIDMQPLSVLGFTLVSAVIVLVIMFFDLALDYKRVEYVQFEDEDNYYYVKIVNKLTPEAHEEKPARRPVRIRLK